ncbi:MAG: MFS transporter [Sandaracinaceae bacterium]
MKPMAVLFLALFNSILGLSILFPVLPPLGRELGLQEWEIGLLSSGYALSQLLFAPAWGRRSERVGRRPVLMIGVLGFAVGFAAFAGVAELGLRHALGHWTLLALLLSARTFGGALSSATLPTAQAYAADLSDSGSRTSAMAVIGAAFGLGIVFGPAIGGLTSWATGSLLAPVYLSSAVALVNAVFIRTSLPEPPKRDASTPRPSPPGGLVRRLFPLLATSLVVTLASVAMEQTIAFYFQDRLHLTELETPRYVGGALVAYGVVAVLAQGFLVRRFKLSPLTLMRFGLPIAFVGYAALPFCTSFVPMTLALVTQGLGQGLLLPGVTAAISLAAGDHDQGPAAGLNGSATGLGRLLGPAMGPALYGLGRSQAELGPGLPYAVSAILVLGLLAIVLTYRRFVPDPAPAPEP